jgi:hypothetical protein
VPRSSPEPTSEIFTADDADEYGAEHWRSKEAPSPEDLEARMNDPDFQEVLHMWNEIAWNLIDEDDSEAPQVGPILDLGREPGDQVRRELAIAVGSTSSPAPVEGPLEQLDLLDWKLASPSDGTGQHLSGAKKEHQAGWESASPKDGATQHLDGVKQGHQVGWESASPKDGTTQHLDGANKEGRSGRTSGALVPTDRRELSSGLTWAQVQGGSRLADIGNSYREEIYELGASCRVGSVLVHPH